jgi:regulator of sigma E protease
MQGLIMTGQLLLGLSILVVLHEFGHYITARMFGIRVEKFYLFFDAWNVKLLKIKYKGTEYGIGWLPFGGYVKISGMIDESMDKEQMKQPPQPWEFRSKLAWQRLIVMLGGVFLNAVLGVVIFSFMLKGYTKEFLPVSEVNKHGIFAFELAEDVGFETGDRIVSIDGNDVTRFEDVTSLNVLFGSQFQVMRGDKPVEVTVPDTLYKQYKKQYTYFIEPLNYPCVIDSVVVGGNAQQAGLQKGDKIIAVAGTQTPSHGKVQQQIRQNKGENIQIAYVRNSVTDTLEVLVDSSGIIGFISQMPYQGEKYSLAQAFKYGTKDAFAVITTNIKGLGKIFSGEEKARESLQGPIGIAKIYGGKWVWEKFWFITGLLSMVLALMNILPIPALDGGHVMLILIETVMGRKIPDKAMEVIQIIGLVIVVSLMVFVIGNDISGLFNK